MSVVWPLGATKATFSNDGGFRDARSLPVSSHIAWTLDSSGPERLPKTLYVRFGDTQTFQDDIILDQSKPSVSSASIGSGGATASAAVAATAASKGQTYRVRIRAQDATSGVAKVQFAARSKRRPSALRKFSRISRYEGNPRAEVRASAGSRRQLQPVAVDSLTGPHGLTRDLGERPTPRPRGVESSDTPVRRGFAPVPPERAVGGQGTRAEPRRAAPAQLRRGSRPGRADACETAAHHRRSCSRRALVLFVQRDSACDQDPASAPASMR